MSVAGCSTATWDDPAALPADVAARRRAPMTAPARAAVADFLAGMTDRYAHRRVLQAVRTSLGSLSASDRAGFGSRPRPAV